MSLAELLPAIRALPKAEQVQLLHLLVDGVAEAPPAEPPKPPSVEEQLLERLGIEIPPGFVAEVWFPEANPEAVAAAMEALAAMKEGRGGV